MAKNKDKSNVSEESVDIAGTDARATSVGPGAASVTEDQSPPPSDEEKELAGMIQAEAEELAKKEEQERLEKEQAEEKVIDLEPSSINTEEEAMSYATSGKFVFPHGTTVVYVTEDKQVFSQENSNSAFNYATNKNLKLFTLTWG